MKLAGSFYQKKNIGLKSFTDECEEFPNGEFDDIVDSMSQFLLNEKGKPAGDYKSIKHLPRGRIKTKYHKYRNKKLVIEG